MSSADFLLVKPLKLDGAVSFSRASEATYFDAAGVLQTAPPNTLRVTYDPADLSKAPYALVEPEVKNLFRYSEDFTNGAWFKTGCSVTPNTGVGPNGNGGATMLTEGSASGAYLGQNIVVSAGNKIVLSVFTKSGTSNRGLALVFTGPTVGANQIVSIDLATLDVAIISGSPTWKIDQLPNGWMRLSASVTTIADGGIATQIRLTKNQGITYTGDGVSGNLVWGAMLSSGDLSSYVKAEDVTGTRAADVVGPGAGLVYSNVPITEPLWGAGTYALGAKVRDAANFVFESLVAGNTAALTDKTKWLPLGITNRLKMFDKAVNSQTTAPDSLTVVVKAGQLANTLTLLNVGGSEVTVTQSDSGYSRRVSLVSHNVLSWYDFWYQEPQWVGDITIGDIPPYINSLLTIHVKSPTNLAALGGFFMGRAKFIGKTQWGLRAGILSYSGEEEDEFGNVTLRPRDSAKKMNFEVAIPRGYEDEVFRFLTAADKVEMVAIASTNWSMTQSYGYLGQWEVPLGIEGEKMPVEWRGLI